MRKGKKLTAKDVALIVCFAALYANFCFWPAFSIVGLQSKAITLAAIMAPIIGMILGAREGKIREKISREELYSFHPPRTLRESTAMEVKSSLRWK